MAIVATAAHCLNTCLLPSFDYQPDIGLVHTVTGPIDAIRVTEQAPKHLDCPDYIDETFNIDDYGWQAPQIVLGRARPV